MIIEAVNTAIQDRKTTRSDVAKNLKGLQKSALYRLLAGQGNTSLGNLEELLRALGLTVVPKSCVKHAAVLRKKGYDL